MTDALSRVTHYGYDNNGNKISETDALGRATTYTYDLNRLTKISYPKRKALDLATDDVVNLTFTIEHIAAKAQHSESGTK